MLPQVLHSSTDGTLPEAIHSVTILYLPWDALSGYTALRAMQHAISSRIVGLFAIMAFIVGEHIAGMAIYTCARGATGACLVFKVL